MECNWMDGMTDLRDLCVAMTRARLRLYKMERARYESTTKRRKPKASEWMHQHLRIACLRSYSSIYIAHTSHFSIQYATRDTHRAPSPPRKTTPNLRLHLNKEANLPATPGVLSVHHRDHEPQVRDHEHKSKITLTFTFTNHNGNKPTRTHRRPRYSVVHQPGLRACYVVE